MTRVHSHLRLSPPRHPARMVWGIALLVGLGTVGTAHAQRSTEPGSGDHAGPSHGRMLRSGRLEGPPAPAFMRDSIRVGGKELQQYTQQYDSHMAATKPIRDSVRAGMQAVRAAYEKGDREAARAGREKAQEQWKKLAEQDKKFDDNLKNVLTKDQQTRYEQWKDRRKQEAREEWREHRWKHGSR
jgi:Spy/CpxP family protein refolding chaperone